MKNPFKVTYQERFMPELDNYLIVYNYPYTGVVNHLFTMTLASILDDRNVVGCWRIKKQIK